MNIFVDIPPVILGMAVVLLIPDILKTYMHDQLEIVRRTISKIDNHWSLHGIIVIRLLEILVIPQQIIQQQYQWMLYTIIFSIVSFEKTALAEEKVFVTSDGGISYYLKSRITTYCSMEYELFPFDIQVCKIQFSSWLYHGAQVCIVFLH